MTPKDKVDWKSNQVNLAVKEVAYVQYTIAKFLSMITAQELQSILMSTIDPWFVYEPERITERLCFNLCCSSDFQTPKNVSLWFLAKLAVADSRHLLRSSRAMLLLLLGSGYQNLSRHREFIILHSSQTFTSVFGVHAEVPLSTDSNTRRVRFLIALAA